METNPTETALAAAAAHGDDKALATIYRQHKDRLLTMATALLGDRHGAEDVLQDVFVSLATRDGELVLRGSLWSYLRTACINRVRSAVRRRRTMVDVALEDDPPTNAEPSALEAADESARLVAALARLPEEQRQTVAMHVHGGMTFREIAETAGTSINTVQSRYRYALAALRRMLGEQGDES